MQHQQTTVNTSEYERTHGRKPRGYGMWAFVTPDGGIVWMTGTYAAMRARLLPGNYTVGT